MIIACDFDGTLCSHKFPDIGEEITHVVEWVKEQKKNGAKLILWTCREGYHLNEAVTWCEKRNITFDAINENVPSLKNKDFGIRKPYADLYLDDRNITIDNLPREQ
jgi:hydroxymethylpyrimidine pyrophosphatase-like HAD family hydrolase